MALFSCSNFLDIVVGSKSVVTAWFNMGLAKHEVLFQRVECDSLSPCR